MPSFLHKTLTLFLAYLWMVSPLCGNSSQSHEYHIWLQKGILKHYSRPCTILDVSGKAGDYILQLSRAYPESVFVILNPDKRLITQCNADAKLSNIIILNQKCSISCLSHLADCEHFDVTIVGNLLNPANKEWSSLADTLLRMSDHLVMECKDHPEIEKYLIASGAKKIACKHDELLTNFSYHNAKHILRRKTWLRAPISDDLYFIDSSYESKQLTKPASGEKNKRISTHWVPGINLCTFKMCSGVLPTYTDLLEALSTIKDSSHSDWMINNMIVGGKKLTLIDYDDQQSKRYYSDELYKAHLEILSINDPPKIEHYFWHKLIRVPVTQESYQKLIYKLIPDPSSIIDIGDSNDLLSKAYGNLGAKCIQYHDQESINYQDFEKLNQNDLCFIRLHPRMISSIFSHISRPFGCLAFRFSVECKQELVQMLKQLSDSGYQKFNFSIRDIPRLALEDSRYRGTSCNWARSNSELLEEINRFNSLEHEPSSFWGYIYARP